MVGVGDHCLLELDLLASPLKTVEWGFFVGPSLKDK